MEAASRRRVKGRRQVVAEEHRLVGALPGRVGHRRRGEQCLRAGVRWVGETLSREPFSTS
jgi:hypothetical protein